MALTRLLSPAASGLATMRLLAPMASATTMTANASAKSPRSFSSSASSTSSAPGASSPLDERPRTPPPPRHPGPLAGVKVLDLGQVVAGNFAGALLAYFGADVIKVESPRGGGDPLRSLRVLDSTGTSLWWRSYGRNRRCVAADLKTEGGRRVVRRLAERVDVVIENFRPGVAEGFGLGPKDLPASLVYTRISGYGQDGPKVRNSCSSSLGALRPRSRKKKKNSPFFLPKKTFFRLPQAPLPGYASVCEAEGGFRAINGFPGGEGQEGAGLPPVRPNCSLGDNLAGLHAAFGTVLALRARDADPLRRGQVVDVALTESVFNMLEAIIPESADAGVSV